MDNIVVSSGYDLTSFQCDYNAGATTGTCSGAGLDVAAPAASAVVLVGATLTGNAGTPLVGNQNGSFDFTVLYQ